MKRIGLIGGISWISTIDYYRFINEDVHSRLGGLNYADHLSIYSINFGDIQDRGWEHSYDRLLEAGDSLKKGGADALVFCANTAHMFALQIQNSLHLPVIHIIEETAKAIQKKGLKKLGLLGTIYTMEKDFYRDKLSEYGLEILIPENQATRNYIQYTLKEELSTGIILQETRLQYISIIQDLMNRGAEGIILGCTEIPLIINQSDFDFPVFDTTEIHCKSIVDFMLSNKNA